MREPDAVASVKERLSKAEAARACAFECMGRNFVVHEDVFPPTHFQSTGIFTKSLRYASGRSFLEIGCGAGVTAVTAALAGCRPVVASDISEQAVRNARVNAELHGVTNVVSVRHGDLFDVLRDGERFDVIFWNSNFVFVPEDYVYTKEVHRAFFDAGYASHDRFLREAPSYLNPGGQLLLGFSGQGNEQALRQLLAKHRYAAETFSSTLGVGPNAPRYDILRLCPMEKGVAQ
jgi:release factor glutamine methyltransferase